MRRLFLLSLINLFGFCLFAQDLPWPAESPSPDGYGYTWKTNSASGGPQYSWVEISNTGTVVEGLGDDNFVGPIPLGIDFEFYWLNKTEVWISSNGHISFAPYVIASNADGFPPSPRSTDGKNDLIAPYLSDLNAGENEGGNPNLGQVLYLSDPANNRFIVTYKNIPYWVNNADGWQGANTFQVILDGNDNSITFQYKTMFGDWSPSYNSSMYPFTVGIEAITGTFGLSATGTAAVTAADRPVNQTAIQFIPPTSPSPVTDVGVSSVGPSGDKGFFVPWNPFPLEEEPRFRLRGKIRNFGSADVNSAIIIQTQVTDSLELLYVNEIDTLYGGLSAGQEREFVFEDVFYPAFESSYDYDVRILNSNTFGDINPGNDQEAAEMITIDTSQADIILSYINRDEPEFVTNPNLTAEDDGQGLFFAPPAYPATVKELQFRIARLSVDPISPGLEIADVGLYGVSQDGSIPGPELYRTSFTGNDLDPANFDGDYFRVVLPTPVTLTEGGFYVGWFQEQSIIGLSIGGTAPISGQSFEVSSGTWAPDRNANTQEFFIRAIISLDDNAVYTPIDKEIEDLARFEAYPNPNDGSFTLEVELDNPSELGIKVYDLAGNKVYLEFEPVLSRYSKVMDLSHLSEGMYILQISTAKGVQSKRIIIR